MVELQCLISRLVLCVMLCNIEAVSSMSFNSSKPIDSMIIRVYLLFVTYFIVFQLIPFSVVAHAASSLLFFHCGSI